MLLLLYAFVPAASTATDAEISNQSATHMDEFALSLASLTNGLGSLVPVIAGLVVLIVFFKAST
ncbi:hypothetical protein A4G99_03755 [Haladaptatus sp. R4]|uniref:hypothetical protein n=1 Tax=Haladaptatus sp. R4 TaxID=1679489 RepID=UPI0007B476EB|nr:hypothetical protein [Haladaptatus sp. R4]KZN25595.1 hypothetical protein A4G99_03755 [Haladaptatus sp. R4]